MCSMSTPCTGRFRTPAHPLGDAADERLAPPRQLPRRAGELGGPAADFDTYYFVADLHALTVPTDPEVLRRRTRVTAAQFIAGGVDPETSAVFCQSHVAQHTELAWVLACQTAMGEMNRMTQFKDKTAKGRTPTSASSPTRCSWRPTSSCTTRPSCRWGGPAPAPRDHARPRRVEQRASATCSRCRALHPQGVRQDHGPPGAHREDEQVRVEREGDPRAAARTPRGSPRRSARRSPTPRPRCATTPRPSRASPTSSSSTRCCRDAGRVPRGRLRRAGLRRPQEGRRRGRRRGRHARSASG